MIVPVLSPVASTSAAARPSHRFISGVIGPLAKSGISATKLPSWRYSCSGVSDAAGVLIVPILLRLARRGLVPETSRAGPGLPA